MSRPTANAERSTISGIRGGAAMSRRKLRLPRARLPPAVSIAALADAGFTSGRLLGDAAATRFSTRKRTRCSSRQPSPASPTSAPAARPVAR
jgi:hypothetical protein